MSIAQMGTEQKAANLFVTYDKADLETVRRALALAEDEIHNPGSARASNVDVLDLIDRAKTILKRGLAVVTP